MSSSTAVPATPTTASATPAAPVDRVANALAAAQAAAGKPPSTSVGPASAPPAPTAPAVAAPPSATQPAAQAPAASSTAPAPAATPAVPTAPSEGMQLSWDMIKAGEKKLTADRQAFKAERDAAKAQPQAAPIPRPGAGDPLPLLYAQGWTPDTLARHLLATAKGEPQGGASGAPAVAAAPAPQAAQPTADAALEARIARMEGYMITQRAEGLLSDQKYSVLRRQPDAVNRVLTKAGELYDMTGELTLDKAAAIVQEELLASLKAQLADEQTRTALGLTPPAPAPSATAPAAPAPAAAELDSITNNLAAPSVPSARPLTHYERLQRAEQAAKAARQAMGA